MNTKATSDLPHIEWERGELVEKHDYVKEYGCSGESTDGRRWIGTWNECGDEVEIENIEEA